MLKRGESVQPDLDIFVSKENIAHYCNLLQATLDERARRTILGLLADQFARLRERS